MAVGGTEGPGVGTTGGCRAYGAAGSWAWSIHGPSSTDAALIAALLWLAGLLLTGGTRRGAETG